MCAMDRALYEAARSGDVSWLRRIRDGNETITLDLHQKTPKDNNILHIAAEYKQIDFFKNVDPDQFGQLFWATNRKGDTPLHVASRVGCDEVVKYLIEHAKKAVSPEGDDEESGGLADADSEAYYKQLLRMNNFQKDTAMHVAVRCNHRRVVILLMEADPELCCLTNRADESPLFLATRYRLYHIADSILRNCPISPSFQGTYGLSALHAAVTHNKEKNNDRVKTMLGRLVKTMVSKSPEIIKQVDAIGWTPLHYAALSGDPGIIQILLEADDSASYILDNSGMSALHIAAYAGHWSVMKEVIRCRPDACDLLNHKGQTALHAAVLGGRKEVVKYMLQTPTFAGLINEADADGNTPMHLAAIYKENDVADILVEDTRVDKHAINNKFYKALDILLGDVSDDDFKESITVRRRIRKMGKSVGVPFFHEKILGHFTKLESPEREPTSTLAIANKTEKPQPMKSDKASRAFDTNQLVAVLIATVTFTAAFTMPGGFKSDGTPVLQDEVAFKVFLVFNALSFFVSIWVVAINFLAANFLKKIKFARPSFIQYSIFGMMVAFASAIFAVLPKGNRGLGTFVYVICGCLGLWASFGYCYAKYFWRPLMKNIRSGNPAEFDGV